MDIQFNERLMEELVELKAYIDDKLAKKLDLEQLERIIKKLSSFSPECEECNRKLNEVERHINELRKRNGQLSNEDFKQHNRIIGNIKDHMHKAHNIVAGGYYLGIYMSLGMSVGLVFGMLVFDNIALGLPIGMCLGMAIGSGLDEDAKKKGKSL